ncbi:DUF2795 domain-containing protein [Catellatospora tritici]|uniref:DUF2795 domain-containing protein n=1 Tax=Catellatospora tritici TaxID=2851566 RepID=UPI001C2D3468|nr:DUF2795 domain-containing protein [Catellatospora tritici]MBV1849271.1 DUF2795 domain-containing protein [Catellatospora tritici]
MQNQDWAQMQQALRDIDFPADKDAILAHVLEYTSDSGVVKLARTLPPEIYRNMSELRSSVRLDPSVEEGTTSWQRAAQARSHNKRVASYLRAVPDTHLS